MSPGSLLEFSSLRTVASFYTLEVCPGFVSRVADRGDDDPLVQGLQ
jgi:hypothetical protein